MHFYSYCSNALFYGMLSDLHGAFRGSVCVITSRGYPWVMTKLVLLFIFLRPFLWSFRFLFSGKLMVLLPELGYIVWLEVICKE